MRTGDNDRDLTALEKQAGQKAARTIRRNLKAILSAGISEGPKNSNGTMLRIAGATAQMKYDSLDSIAIKASTVTFIHHYGFEGIKKNGVAMNLKARDSFNDLFKRTNALEKLADEIGSIRMEEVTAKLLF